MKQGWVTDDQQFFETREQAEQHEQLMRLKASLVCFFEERITYSDDAGYACATPTDVVDIIIGELDTFLLQFEEDSAIE